MYKKDTQEFEQCNLNRAIKLYRHFVIIFPRFSVDFVIVKCLKQKSSFYYVHYMEPYYLQEILLIKN